MKKTGFFLLFCIAAARMTFSQGLYDINTIQEIHIVFPQSNWDYLLDSLAALGDEYRLPGTVFVNGQEFDSAGIRYKGNSSYNPDQVKNPLNIKLDDVIDDQTYEGYGTIKLSNGFKDPSLVRETMSYEMARKYMPAPLSNYAKVTINDQYIGLYTSNQDVDRYFMTNWFTASDNARLKGEMNGTLPPGQYGVWKYYGTDSSDYFPVFTLESDIGWNELVNFLDTVNNDSPYLEEVLNVDRHLWLLAFENLLVNLDSPINNPQNYYLDKDDAGRFNPVVWDLNETFGVFSNLNGSGPQSLLQLQQMDPFVHVTDVNYPVLNKILTDPLYKRMYVAHMKTMLSENFTNGWYLDRALEIQGIIGAEVQADPNKLYTYQNFIDNVYTTVGGGGPPPGGMPIPGITELMEPRITFLGNQAMFTAQAPEITAVGAFQEAGTRGATIWFTAHVEDATLVQLGYCPNTEGRFIKTEMFDDGNHNDSLAGDHLYGASLAVGATGIRYYVFADNGNACSFSPERAEFEYYTVPVTLTLVINEFMASNVSWIQDQDGEYDDWVEIHNNTGSAINLDGYNISDKPDNIDKWTFPDTTIAPGGYLVVWCDEDSSQAGLHANFKLSALGEQILLSDPGLTILDEVTFGAQKTDTTTGRYPNGTGSFIFMHPTFGAENVNGFPTGIGEPGNGSAFCLGQNYPNPFSATTTIPIRLERETNLRLEIRDMNNRPVEVLFDGRITAGEHSFRWESEGYAAGIYICLLIAENQVHQIKLLKI